MKYILVTGGVISGIGKGVIASSIGKILKTNGYEVTAIKIDPYINIDAGTFSPYEHGEVFVLDDGGEVDLDLGNYERFIDIKLHRDNNITTGKIYQSVINRERKGEFLGKTVQVVPHITDAIQEWVERVALKPVSNGGEPEICIIELGGTIGDIEGMPFVEAFRQFQFRVKKENFCCVHVSLVPQPKATNEHKTKPTQASVRELRGLGLSPDLIVCRSENPIDEVVKEKISNFCHVPPEQVVCLHDVKSVYHVPMFMEDQNLVEFFHERLQLPLRIGELTEEGKNLSRKWRKLVQKMDHHIHEVNIAIVGKYTGLEDAYASVVKALQHATIECSVKLNIKFIAAADLEPATLANNAVRYHEAWQELCKSNGVVVPGGFGSNGVEGKMAASAWARKNKIPYLAICFGFQIAVIEFARNVLGWEDADTYEISQDRSKRNVVIEMPEHHTGIMGGTMRLGKKLTMFKTDDSILRTLYKKEAIEERHRHRYEVDKVYVPDMERAGLKFVAEDETGERLEIFELQDHPYYVGVQFHPEYISRPLRPSPPYLGLILASCNKLKHVLEKGIQPQNDINLFSDDEIDGMQMETDTPKVPLRPEKRGASQSWCQPAPPTFRVRTTEPNMGQQVSNMPMRMNICKMPMNQIVWTIVSPMSGGQNELNAVNVGENQTITGMRLATTTPGLVHMGESNPPAGQLDRNQRLGQNTQQEQALSVANSSNSESNDTAGGNQVMPSQSPTTSAATSSDIPLPILPMFPSTSQQGQQSTDPSDSTNDMQRTIWQGTLEFEEMVQGNNVTYTLACTFLSLFADNDESYFNSNMWPNRLSLQFIPGEAMKQANLFPVLKTDAKNVLIHYEECEASVKMLNNVNSQKVGLVQFPSHLDIRVMVILYVPNSRSYVGLIANDQQAYFNSVSRLYPELHNQQEQSDRMHPADNVPNS